MPEHIRALLFVLALSGAVFFIARPVFIDFIAEETFDRWRKLWFFTTLAWFLSHSFWIYAILMLVMLAKTRKTEPHVFGLYLLLTLAAPPAEMTIPGFGLIDQLFALSHYRLLSLALLLPIALRLAKDPDRTKMGAFPIDLAVMGYLLWLCLLGFRGTTITNGFRIIFQYGIDLFLPYYVASRSLKTVEDFRGALAGLLLGTALVSAMALFEVTRNWRLYASLGIELGFTNYPSSYKMRGSFLRPAATVVDSISVGWVIAISIGGLLFFAEKAKNKTLFHMLFCLIALGVIGAMSRAPWVAAILLGIVFLLQTDNAVSNLAKLGALAVLAFATLNMFPAGKEIIDLLPYIGKAEQGSVTYRENLISAAIPVIMSNFFTGNHAVPDIAELQILRTGEGIVDLVNAYLAVLLYAGAIGFLLFISMFISAFFFVLKSKRRLNRDAKEAIKLGRVLIAMHITNAFMLVTVSMFLIGPILLYSILGLCAAYGFMCHRQYIRKPF